jgi:dTDP-4-dehydrorhamnose 3,5-epimerase
MIEIIRALAATDDRGVLFKSGSPQWLDQQGLSIKIKDHYISTSRLDVFRGLHCQVGKAKGRKIVQCIQGSILDVILDLRLESHTYGECVTRRLSSNDQEAIIVPEMCAHGFLSLEDKSIVSCATEHLYAPERELCVNLHSLNIELPTTNPILSEKDKNGYSLKELLSSAKIILP